MGIFDDTTKMPVRGKKELTKDKSLKYICSVKDDQGTLAKQTAKIPNEETFGSLFGLCICGVTKTDQVLCNYMAAVAKMSWLLNLVWGMLGALPNHKHMQYVNACTRQ